MSFVFKSTRLNAANIIYRFGRFKQYDNSWFKKITKLSKVIKKGHRYNLRQWRFNQKKRGFGWVNNKYHGPNQNLYTINYISRGHGHTRFLNKHWHLGIIEDWQYKHENRFLFSSHDTTKQSIIDTLEENNIKYKKSWKKDKLYALLFTY